MQARFAITSLVAAVAAFAASASFAGGIVGNTYPGDYPAGQGFTAQQVQAQLAAAARDGALLAPGEAGLTMREIYTGRYAPSQVAAGASRNDVEQQLFEAIRTGDYIVGGEIGGKCKDLHPEMHATR